MQPKKKKKKLYEPDTVEQAKLQADPLRGYAPPQLHPAIPPAFTQAVQSGGDPQALAKARQYLGDKDFINLCEAFVEKASQGSVGHFKSAIDAWMKQQSKAVPGVQGMAPGDAIYFSPNQGNGQYGHTGLYSGNGNFVSATPSGVKELPIGQWVKSTGQSILGYIKK